MAKGMNVIRYRLSGFGVLMWYLFDRPKKPNPGIWLGGNVVERSAIAATARFLLLFEGGRQVDKPFAQLAIRFPADERVERRKLISLCDAYLTALGYSPAHPRIYVLHDDEKGQHVHIVTCRIEVGGGKLYIGANENLKSTRILRELEHTFALRITDHTEWRSGPPNGRNPAPPSPSSPFRARAIELWHRMQDTIDNALSTSPNLKLFVSLLNRKGIGVSAFIDQSGKVAGLVFRDGCWVTKGSDLGPKFSWPVLLRRGLDYHVVRDQKLALEMDLKAGDRSITHFFEDEEEDFYGADIDYSYPESYDFLDEMVAVNKKAVPASMIQQSSSGGVSQQQSSTPRAVSDQSHEKEWIEDDADDGPVEGGNKIT